MVLVAMSCIPIAGIFICWAALSAWKIRIAQYEMMYQSGVLFISNAVHATSQFTCVCSLGNRLVHSESVAQQMWWSWEQLQRDV